MSAVNSNAALLLLPPRSCLSELAAQLRDAPAGATIDLGGLVVSGALPEGKSDVLSITQPGGTLRNGTLRFTGRQHVAIAAAGVAMKDVNIIVAGASADGGHHGLLLVIGSRCSLELRGCHAAAGTLMHDYVLLRAGGSARLVVTYCSVTSCAGGTACTVMGTSKLTVRRSTFQGCGSHLLVSTSSAAELTRSTFSSSSDASQSAVGAADIGSSLTALDCDWSANAGGDGLSIPSRAHATLTGGSSLCGSRAGGVDIIGFSSSLNYCR